MLKAGILAVAALACGEFNRSLWWIVIADLALVASGRTYCYAPRKDGALTGAGDIFGLSFFAMIFFIVPLLATIALI